MQRIDPTFSKQAKEFYDACELARQCDPALMKMYNWYQLPEYHGVSLCMQMAYEGNEQAVDFMRDNFLLTSMLDIIQGYARAGNTNRVNEMLNHPGRMNYAVPGYAFVGLHDEVNDLLARGATESYAMQGYARGGFVEEAWALTDPTNILGEGEICRSFAFAGLHDQVNLIILSSRNELIQASYMYDAYCGYQENGLYENEYHFIDVMLAVCDDMRKYIKDIVCLDFPRDAEFDIPQALAKFEAINAVMDDYHINFRQAQALRQKGVRETILQADKIGGLTHDTTLQIFSHRHGLDYQETKGLFEAVSRNTHQGANQLLLTKYYGLYFAGRGSMDGEMRPQHKKHKRDREELNERYDERKERRVGL